MASQVRALVFDAYGTLFDPSAVKIRAEELFPGNGAALSQIWRAKQLEYSWLRTLMGRYENFWKITEDALLFSCRTLKLSCAEHQRKQLMQVYLTLPAFPEVKPALEKGTLEMLTAVVAASGMAHFFQHIFSVDSLRIYKPGPEVYQHAATSLGIPKESIGFISSNFWDIAAATSFGFRTFWLNRHSVVPEELGVTPAASLQALSDLPTLVGHS